MKDSVIIVSGGMDSITLLHEKVEEIALAVTFDYGSNHNKREAECAARHCQQLGIEHIIIPLAFIGQYFKSSLLEGADAVPEGHYEAENMKSTVVPFRNGIMLSVACGLAESRKLSKVLIANHGGDHAIYPDCRAGFVHSMSEAMRHGTYIGVQIDAPYTGIRKSDIRMNHAMDENVLLASKQRYVLSDTAGVNEEELADLSRDIVHVAGRLGDESFRPLQTAGLQGNSLSYRNSRIEELKEISGNRDMTQGGTAGGVTAASAIAALQEAGSKLSRDMLKSAYRAFARECYLIIDLMRQFYDEERVFRVIGPAGGREFVPFSGAALRARPMGLMGGVELGSREPVFDIVVSAEKKSTFSRLSQNETAKECYQLGFFAPQNADAALAALEMMDFEGIEKVRQRVRQNGTLAQKLTAAQMQIARFNEKLSGAEENLSTRALAKNLSGALRQLS